VYKRQRGLGDVYKRQGLILAPRPSPNDGVPVVPHL
jgi:hypothetical protein